MDLADSSTGLVVKGNGPADRQYQAATDSPHGLGKPLLGIEPDPDQKPITERLNARNAVNENILNPLRFFVIERTDDPHFSPRIYVAPRINHETEAGLRQVNSNVTGAFRFPCASEATLSLVDSIPAEDRGEAIKADFQANRLEGEKDFAPLDLGFDQPVADELPHRDSTTSISRRSCNSEGVALS